MGALRPTQLGVVEFSNAVVILLKGHSASLREECFEVGTFEPEAENGGSIKQFHSMGLAVEHFNKEVQRLSLSVS